MNTQRTISTIPLESEGKPARRGFAGVLGELGQKMKDRKLEKLGEKLVFAAAKGEKDKVARLLKAGVDVNYYRKANDIRVNGTALIAATMHGQKEVAELLIQNKADPNVKDLNYGATPLMHSCPDDGRSRYEGREQMIELLLKNGADPNAQDKSGATALMWAVLHGRESAVELLLKNGADPNIVDISDESVLKIARDNRKGTSIINLLKEYGAKEDSKEELDDGELSQAELNEELLAALKEEDLGRVKELLDAGADPKSLTLS